MKMSTNMSILKETSHNVNIESSSQDFTQHMQLEPSCTNAYKKQLSHANQDRRNTQNSSSTASHINALQTPGHFPLKVQEYLESTQNQVPKWKVLLPERNSHHI